MGVSHRTKVYLALTSGNRCAFSNCRETLAMQGESSDIAIIGEAAHIFGENPGSARYDAAMTNIQRNHYDNLIYLCPTCHTHIDKREQDFPVHTIKNIKIEHEKWVNQQLDKGLSNLGFSELEEAIKTIASAQYTSAYDFHIITPEAKIEKNNLSQEVRVLISMGLSRSAEISEYLSKAAQLDITLPERLKQGFKDKYLELKNTFSGDALFMELLVFAEAGQAEFTKKAASLTILCHLFELCEVFEK